jgi:hypothetical protein
MSRAVQGRVVAIGCAVIALLMGGPRQARADVITLTVTSGPSLQQIENRPCVIGDPSCHNKDTLPFTLIPPHDGSDTLSSPTYTVDQIRALVGGNTFDVGIDLNQAMGHDGGAYTLSSFTLAVDGVTMFGTGAPTTLLPINPGNGFSDASIHGFDLSGLSGSQKLVFTTTFRGATGGREQFFLTPGSPGGTGNGAPSNTPPVPEPATLILLGSGLGAVMLRQRARR